jgi:hypothetical protein
LKTRSWKLTLLRNLEPILAFLLAAVVFSLIWNFRR